MGSSEKETKSDTSTEEAMVSTKVKEEFLGGQVTYREKAKKCWPQWSGPEGYGALGQPFVPWSEVGEQQRGQAGHDRRTREPATPQESPPVHGSSRRRV